MNLTIKLSLVSFFMTVFIALIANTRVSAASSTEVLCEAMKKIVETEVQARGGDEIHKVKEAWFSIIENACKSHDLSNLPNSKLHTLTNDFKKYISTAVYDLNNINEGQLDAWGKVLSEGVEFAASDKKKPLSPEELQILEDNLDSYNAILSAQLLKNLYASKCLYIPRKFWDNFKKMYTKTILTGYFSPSFTNDANFSKFTSLTLCHQNINFTHAVLYIHTQFMWRVINRSKLIKESFENYFFVSQVKLENKYILLEWPKDIEKKVSSYIESYQYNGNFFFDFVTGVKTFPELTDISSEELQRKNEGHT